jgi:hypothetical protein
MDQAPDEQEESGNEDHKCEANHRKKDEPDDRAEWLMISLSASISTRDGVFGRDSNEGTDRLELRRERGRLLGQARFEKNQFVPVGRVGGFQKRPVITFGTEDRYSHNRVVGQDRRRILQNVTKTPSAPLAIAFVASIFEGLADLLVGAVRIVDMLTGEQPPQIC